jgi:HSP20 family protein
MVQSLFSPSLDLFAELEGLQRDMEQILRGLGTPSSIRAAARGSFPAINSGATPKSIEIYAFAPGLDPAKLDVSVEQGLLTIAGERQSDLPEDNDQVTVYAAERFAGGFKRVLSLPEDVDPSSVEAHYRNGVLHVSVQRRESAQPRRIEVK